MPTFKKRKLTPAEVDLIVLELQKNYRGQIKDLAKRFNVSHATISQLKHGHRRAGYIGGLNEK